MTKDEFIALYEKCVSGECSAGDLELLEKYRDGFELTDGDWLPEMGDREAIKMQLYSALQSRLYPVKPKRLPNYKWMAAAASILVFFAIGLFFLIKPKKQNSGAMQIVKTGKPLNIIVPGSNKAILTLANGEKVDLDSSGRGVLSRQGAVVINKLADGKIVYNTAVASTPANSIAYNAISTPRGGQYQVTLSDGTHVWLNAASSLKYPTAFSGHERTVELTGEAYFEVAKNKDMPFNVLVNGMNVKVLGTHFNIMAYDDESSVQTTLLEGAVQLSRGNNQALLAPGQQGVLQNGQSAFKLREVNVDDVIAWKNGFFSFENEDIENIMRKVSRWYDVDVAYKGNLVNQYYGGSVSRFKDITELLKTLELTGTIHFKIEGRRVTVMP